MSRRTHRTYCPDCKGECSDARPCRCCFRSDNGPLSAPEVDDFYGPLRRLAQTDSYRRALEEIFSQVQSLPCSTTAERIYATAREALRG